MRWYQQIHPDDKYRWSVEAADMFLSGTALRSAYRVMARDGRVIWFHCEAKMIRRDDGRPWFIHGVGFDITELKRTEEALQKSATWSRPPFSTPWGAGRGPRPRRAESSGSIVRANKRGLHVRRSERETFLGPLPYPGNASDSRRR